MVGWRCTEQTHEIEKSVGNMKRRETLLERYTPGRAYNIKINLKYTGCIDWIHLTQDSFMKIPVTVSPLGLLTLEGQSHSIQESVMCPLLCSALAVKFKARYGHEQVHLNTSKENVPWP